MASTKPTHAEASIRPYTTPAESNVDRQELDVLEYVLGWACRNRRNLAVAPWTDVVRVLRRKGVDVDQVIRTHGGIKPEGGM